MKKFIKNIIKMNKISLIFFLSLTLCSLVFSQESAIQKMDEVQPSNKQESGKEHTKQDYRKETSIDENEYVLIPTLGYSSLGVTAGLDFMYRKGNGFALLTNLNFSVPVSNLGGAIFTSEFYIGYALKKNRFYASFLAGPWVGGGASFVGWDDHPRRRDYMNGHLLTIPSIMITFALRGDLMYFFNDKLGLHFSHAHGFGFCTHAVAMDRRNYPKDLTHYYAYMLKLGLAVRL